MQLEEINRFMAIGAHCDDVDIRCGGTFARLSREGKKGCYVVAVENAHTGSHCRLRSSREALAIRRSESTKAAAMLGADRLEWLEFKSFYFSTEEPDSEIYPSFDSLEALREELKDAVLTGLPPVANAYEFPACRDRLNDLLDDFSPQVVFTHSPDDRNPDHYAVARFVDRILADRRNRAGGTELYCWEPGSAGPIVGYVPDLFVELSRDDVEKKQRAIDCYLSQLRDGAPGFAPGRAKAYGRLANVEYAEVFRRAGCERGDPWKGPPPFLGALESRSRPGDTYRL
jgi:LmbE family N-acetylglucosaminyl deacetylase